MDKKDRRTFLKNSSVCLLSIPFIANNSLLNKKWLHNKDVYFTNGIKISEICEDEVIIWTRLCACEKPKPVVHGRERKPTTYYPLEFDEDQPVELMDGAVKGAEGMVRAKIFNELKQIITDWFIADSNHDFTVQIPIRNLDPNTAYQVKLEGKLRRGNTVTTINGSFKTSPRRSEAVPITLTTSTCQYFWNYDDKDRGFKIYDSMNKLKPSFFVHTGDYVYYDRPGPFACNISKARHKWNAMNSWPAARNFLQSTPIYMLKDDHDLLIDDVHPDSPPFGDLSISDGLIIWRENAPIKDKPYRTFRWGQDLQIWLVEVREFRTPKENIERPKKAIWGEEQKAWFQNTIDESDATFKLVFSPTPIVGPDRERKNDNHANKSFDVEGQWLRNLLSDKKEVFVVCGDRHWQYFSVDGETGVREFGSGPVTDSHAGGWNESDIRPEHRFLRVKGGFLGIKIYREKRVPKISFTHYDVSGRVENEEIFT